MAVQTTTELREESAAANAVETSTAQPQLLTGEEVYAMGDIGRAELIKGVLKRMSPAGHPHGYIEFNLGWILGNFVRQHKLGRILGGGWRRYEFLIT